MSAPNPKAPGPARCVQCREPFAPGAACTEGGRCFDASSGPPPPSPAEAALRLEARALDLERCAVNLRGVAVALRLELERVRRGELSERQLEGMPVWSEARRWLR